MPVICRPVILLFALLMWVAPTQAQSTHDAKAASLPDWHQVIRQTPYWASQGVFDNLTTIRRWVLAGESFCASTERHILYDNRATFLAWITNGESRAETQERLNARRAGLAAEGRVDAWARGHLNATGYPFALSCDQPDAELQTSLDRYTGADANARLWGTWDGMRIGTQDDPVSLHDAIRQVYADRVAMGRIQLPETILATLAGKTIIESGGLRDAHSAANARGIMQLTPGALNDCELDEQFYYHRMAQIDCALRLWEQNNRNLKPVFQKVFGHLPAAKRDRLYSLLLLQAYHGGVGRMQGLLTGPELGRAARYFAEHHARFSASDMALGLIFHNLGRNELGTASLFYLVDVELATRAACNAVQDLPGCALLTD